MNTKRILAAALALTMMVSMLAGCTNANAPTPESTADASTTTESSSAPVVNEASGDTSFGASEDFIATEVRIANADPTSFSPLRQTGNGKNVHNEVYEALIERNGFGGEVYGLLAKDWGFDGNDLRVELYDYIYDSAGNHITANDVKFSYEYSWDAGFTVNRLNTYTDGCEVLSDYELVFHFKPEHVDTLNGWYDLLSGQHIFSQVAWESSPDEMASNAVGTGRYEVKEFLTGAQAVLERRDDYWQTDTSLIAPQHRANVQTITYKFITDSSQIVNALKTGEIDYADNVSEEALPNFTGSPDWTVSPAYDNNIFLCYPNCLEGLPFNDENLRAALFYAINVDDIIAARGGDQYAQKLFNFAVPQCQGYNSDWENSENYYTVANLELAKEYLAKSNYDGKTIQIWYEAIQYAKQQEAVALIVGAALEQLGIKYEIHSKQADFDTLYKTTNSDWDLILTNMGGNGSILDYARNNFNTDVYEGGIGNYYDETFDALYTKVYSESGSTQENINEFWQYLSDNAYVYGFFQQYVYRVYRSDLIKAADTRTFRSWVIPGAFEYVEN